MAFIEMKRINNWMISIETKKNKQFLEGIRIHEILYL